MVGSSGNLEFKQRFSDPNNSDATIFCSNMVSLYCIMYIICNTLALASMFFSLCRPIRMAFIKEDNTTILTEYRRVLVEVNKLNPTKIILLEDKHVIVYHEFLLTMIDGKVINAIVENNATSVRISKVFFFVQAYFILPNF